MENPQEAVLKAALAWADAKLALRAWSARSEPLDERGAPEELFALVDRCSETEAALLEAAADYQSREVEP